MTTLADVRSDLITVLGNLSGWRTAAYVGSGVNPPQLVVTRSAFDPRMVFSGGKCEHTFKVTAYVTRDATVQSEKALDELAEPSGAGSLIAVVQTSSNWSVTIDYAAVTNVGEVVVVQFATDGAFYLACPFEIKVVW